MVAVPAPTNTSWFVNPVSCVVSVLVPGLPTTVIDPVPTVLILPAVGATAPPLLPVKVSEKAAPEIVTVLPDPEVVIPPVPSMSNMFATGTAVPLLVTNSVGIEGVLFTIFVTSR